MPIMDQFKRGVDKAKFEADRLVRINRVQNEVGNLKREIFGVREKIATAVVEHHKQGDLLHTDLKELCRTIDQFELQITEKDAQIAAIRVEALPQTVPSSVMTAVPGAIASTTAGPANPCPRCGFAAPAGAVFCINCGKQIPPPPPKPIVSSSHPCSSCGFSLGTDSAFCPNCGQKVTKAVELASTPEPRKCANCGFALSAEAVFCPSCGKSAVIASVATVAPIATQAPITPPVELPSAPVVESVSAANDMSQIGDTSEVVHVAQESSDSKPVEVIAASIASFHCPQCGFGLPAEATFCTNCGNRISSVSEVDVVVPPPQPRQCSNCHVELLPEAAFCPSCGQRV